MIIKALDYDINIISIINAQVHCIIKPQRSDLHIDTWPGIFVISTKSSFTKFQYLTQKLHSKQIKSV